MVRFRKAPLRLCEVAGSQGELPSKAAIAGRQIDAQRVAGGV